MPERGRFILDVLMRRRCEWVTDCVWCGRSVVNTRLIPPHLSFSVLDHGKKVDLEVGGRLFRMAVVTADHYLESCAGGESTFNNIVPSCATCNNGRTKPIEPPRSKLCVDCGEVRVGPHKRRCSDCVALIDLLSFNPS